MFIVAGGNSRPQPLNGTPGCWFTDGLNSQRLSLSVVQIRLSH